MDSHKILGFTAVEFLITLLVAAIFVVFAVPSYYAMIQNNKIVSTQNLLVSGLNFARMEALKRGSQVSICAANATFTACDNSWQNGFIVFNLFNGNPNILRVQDFSAGINVTANMAQVDYASTGFLSSGAATFSVLAQGCTGNSGRSIVISASGRISTSPITCN